MAVDFMIERLKAMKRRLADIDTILTNGAADISTMTKLNKERATLDEPVRMYNELLEMESNKADALAMMDDADAEIQALGKEEFNALTTQIDAKREELKIALLPKDEKPNIFEKLNFLFNDNKNNELNDELNKLNKNDKNDAINYLKNKNTNKINEIDEIKNLSDTKKKLDVLFNALGGKKENKLNKKEKLKKITDILLNLDKKTKTDCLNYLKNTAENDEKKNDELYSIIHNVSFEQNEENNFNLENNNY